MVTLRLSFVKLQSLWSYSFRVKCVQVLLVCLGCLIFPANLAQPLCQQSSVFAVINLHCLEADISYASAGFLCKQEAAKVTVRQPWKFGPVMIKYRAKREQVQQSTVWAACTSCFSFFFLSHTISPSLCFFSSLSFLAFSALLFCPDKIVAFSMTGKIMRSEGWIMTFKNKLNKMEEFS